MQQIQNGAHIANDVLESELHSIKSDLAYIEQEIHSFKMLGKLGQKLTPPNKLRFSKQALKIGHKPPSSETSSKKLIKLKKFSNNTSLFLTSLNLGKTKSKEELNST